MSTTRQTIPLLVFAKAPRAGQVKTRLQPHCTPEQSADIAEILLYACLENLVENWPGSIKLMVWPDEKTAFFTVLSKLFDVPVHAQCAGDLGVKMSQGMKQFGFPCAVIGSDIPHVAREALREAHKMLAQGNNFIGPAADGGFYMLGMSAEEPRLFQGIEWGTSSVLESTLKNGIKLGVDFRELSKLHDVDHWSDVLRLAPQLPRLNQYLQEQGLG